MGINFEVAALFAKTFSKLKCKGKLLQLGRQTVELTDEQFLKALELGGFASKDGGRIIFINDISGHIKNNTYYRTDIGVQYLNDKTFFGALGVDAYSSDANDYENADYIIDLNSSNNDQIPEQFDVIYNGGTIEHVFNPVNAFATVHHLLKNGGIIIHLAPTNGFVDHGFYQFSPCLLKEYYQANGYQILEMKYIFVNSDGWYIFEHISKLPFSLFQGALLYFVARKMKDSTSNTTPTQELYQHLWGGAERSDESLHDYRQRILIENLESERLTVGTQQRIAIWCGGDFTERMLTNFPKLAYYVKFIVDKDTRKHGSNIAGISIVPQQYCIDNIGNIDNVLISTPNCMPIYNELSKIPLFNGKLILL
ncbi:MAG: class I SAM-dependent methyltransferase [Proteobacteria bacterium]|nr:class I SAM-dependent methyltransferase [Pseudomonadota bacterium]